MSDSGYLLRARALASASDDLRWRFGITLDAIEQRRRASDACLAVRPIPTSIGGPGC